MSPAALTSIVALRQFQAILFEEGRYLRSYSSPCRAEYVKGFETAVSGDWCRSSSSRGGANTDIRPGWRHY